MNEPIQLIPNKPDKELAEELKTELAEAAKNYLDACTRAHKAGFIVNAQFGFNPFGQCVIQQLQLMKVY